jgi:hypothetical protein
MDQRTMLDFAKKLLSRKLLVWIASTVLLCCKVITQDVWQLISITFMGVHAAQAVLTGAGVANKVSALVTKKEDEKEGEA